MLCKQDAFITATFGEVEFVIESIKRVATHANIDDTVTHLTLNLRECGGNLKR